MRDMWLSNRYAWESRNIDASRIVSASAKKVLNGAWTAEVVTTEKLTYGERVRVDGIGEFVVAGFDIERIGRSGWGDGGFVATYSLVSALYYDLSTKVNGPIAGVHQNWRQVLNEVLARTPWKFGSAPGVYEYGEHDVAAGTAWDQFMSVLGMFVPDDDENASMMVVTSMSVDRPSTIHDRTVGVEMITLENSTTIDICSSDVTSARLSMGVLSYADDFAIADKSGALYRDGYVFSGRGRAVMALYKSGTSSYTNYYPERVITNSGFDFAESTEGVEEWGRQVLFSKVLSTAEYEVELSPDADYTPELGDFVSIADDVFGSPFVTQADNAYVVSEVEEDLVTGRVRFVLGEPVRYVPRIERLGA